MPKKQGKVPIVPCGLKCVCVCVRLKAENAFSMQTKWAQNCRYLCKPNFCSLEIIISLLSHSPPVFFFCSFQPGLLFLLLLPVGLHFRLYVCSLAHRRSAHTHTLANSHIQRPHGSGDA